MPVKLRHRLTYANVGEYLMGSIRERLTFATVMSVALVALVALPTGAQAATLTFANPQVLGPSQNAGTAGPANAYPSSISVSGVAGTVTDVNVTILAMKASADTDMVLRGPNGRQVMLMSDACIQGTSLRGSWLFDDSAPGFVSKSGPCSPSFPTQKSFLPSNYLAQPDALDNSVEPDDLSVAPGGPPPPYVNALSSLSGGSPNGSWDLFVLDDNPACCLGFSIDSGWALTLEVEPPPPPLPPDPPPPPPPPPGDTTPPDTMITKATVNSKKHQAKFVFTSTETGSTLSCKLDKKPAGACTSPRTYKKLKVGKHTFQVTATDAAGNTDPTAAVKKFKIKPPS